MKNETSTFIKDIQGAVGKRVVVRVGGMTCQILLKSVKAESLNWNAWSGSSVKPVEASGRIGRRDYGLLAAVINYQVDAIRQEHMTAGGHPYTECMGTETTLTLLTDAYGNHRSLILKGTAWVELTDAKARLGNAAKLRQQAENIWKNMEKKDKKFISWVADGMKAMPDLQFNIIEGGSFANILSDKKPGWPQKILELLGRWQGGGDRRDRRAVAVIEMVLGLKAVGYRYAWLAERQVKLEAERKRAAIAKMDKTVADVTAAADKADTYLAGTNSFIGCFSDDDSEPDCD